MHEKYRSLAKTLLKFKTEDSPLRVYRSSEDHLTPVLKGGDLNPWHPLMTLLNEAIDMFHDAVIMFNGEERLVDIYDTLKTSDHSSQLRPKLQTGSTTEWASNYQDLYDLARESGSQDIYVGLCVTFDNRRPEREHNHEWDDLNKAKTNFAGSKEEHFEVTKQCYMTSKDNKPANALQWPPANFYDVFICKLSQLPKVEDYVKKAISKLLFDGGADDYRMTTYHSIKLVFKGG